MTAWPTASRRKTAARAAASCVIPEYRCANHPLLSAGRDERSICLATSVTSHAAPSAAQLTTPAITAFEAAPAPAWITSPAPWMMAPPTPAAGQIGRGAEQASRLALFDLLGAWEVMTVARRCGETSARA